MSLPGFQNLAKTTPHPPVMLEGRCVLAKSRTMRQWHDPASGIR